MKQLTEQDVRDRLDLYESSARESKAYLEQLKGMADDEYRASDIGKSPHREGQITQVDMIQTTRENIQWAMDSAARARRRLRKFNCRGIT